MTNSSSRREFLRLSAGFSILGAGAPLALQLAAAGSAAAQTADDYRALICIFLAGGQDSNNMVLATDPDNWARYNQARNTGASPIALKAPGVAPDPRAGIATPARWGGVLPITPTTPQITPGDANESIRTFGLHPMLAPVRDLFVQKRVAVLANVGMLIEPVTREQYERRSVEIPKQLFSHNDQQSSWQAGAAEGAQSGWGGRLADMVRGMNGTKTVFTAISAAGSRSLTQETSPAFHLAANCARICSTWSRRYSGCQISPGSEPRRITNTSLPTMKRARSVPELSVLNTIPSESFKVSAVIGAGGATSIF